MAEAGVPEPMVVRLYNRAKNFVKKTPPTPEELRMREVRKIKLMSKIDTQNQIVDPEQQRKDEAQRRAAELLNAAVKTHDPTELERVRRELKSKVA